MDKLTLANVGPIVRADIGFGDLTVLVGPQATGKTIVLQYLKLLEDTVPIRKRLREYGVEWNGSLERSLQTFFGEGMHSLWRSGEDGSTVTIDDIAVDNVATRLSRGGPRLSEASVYYVPAQRALTLRDGWPRPFSDYGPSDPFAVRDFSDSLRLLMEGMSDSEGTLFPKKNRLKAPLRDAVDRSVFHGFGLRIDRSRPQKRLVLGGDEASQTLPYMVWSAGQREFVPLLLGLYWLLPPARSPKRPAVRWVIIEEPEMGLHPEAISAVLLLALELMLRGYRVCLSTHSPHVLDVVWALRVLQDCGGTARDVLKLFDLGALPQLLPIADRALKSDLRVHYFQTTGTAVDISGLDPGSPNPAESGWGGLAGFSGRVGDVVAEVVSRQSGRQRLSQ